MKVKKTAALVATRMLGGCAILSPSAEAIAAADDTTCRGIGLQFGTSEFAQW